MQKILVFRTGLLGDSLVALPAINAIRDNYPDAHLVLLYDQHVGKNYVVSRELFQGSGIFDDFIGYPLGYTIFEKIKAAFAVVCLMLKLRCMAFDMVIHLEPQMKTPARSKRDYYFFRIAGIKRQIQTLSIRPKYIKKHPLRRIEHESDFFLRALSSYGLNVPLAGKGSMALLLGEVEEAQYSNWINGLSIPIDASMIGVGVGSNMEAKRWPKERFLELVKRLVEDFDVYPVFFGGVNDSFVAAEIIETVGVGANACGVLSLRTAIRALRDCALYVGNDTGTMHMAVAAGIKCVGVFSARDVPGKWFPYGDGNIVHRVSVECEGCMLRTCVAEGGRCLSLIKVDDVYLSCEKVLSSKL